MNYTSVRKESPPVTFREALVSGIAPDGGLYIPATLPRLESGFLGTLDNESPVSLGTKILASYITEIPDRDLGWILKRAWTFPIPLIHLKDNIHLLELFHGPTLAFKDIGVRFMAEILSYLLSHEQNRVTIVVATSGDTGSAVASGFHNVPSTEVFILYPSGKVSRLQEQQMTTLGGNIHAIEVDGTFDDCQRMVKEALADKELQAHRILTTANSINLGRLLPQIVYHAWGVAQLCRSGVKPITPPVVVVPSGNLGNLTAGVYAKRMGIPIQRFIAATNINDILPAYLATGSHTVRASVRTYSNAMDVGNPSNFARLQSLYHDNISEMRKEIRGMSFSDEATLGEIQRTYTEAAYILDPHTAIGVAAARRLAERESCADPIIVMATAHPAKFPEIIRQATGTEVALPRQLERSLRLPKISVRIPSSYARWKSILLS